MDRRPLPRSDLSLSVFGLGSLTFGEQTDDEDAFAQMDLAREAGINWIDTAEMYPAPPRVRTQGESERLIGRWHQARGCRDEMILATKVTAPDRGVGHIREGQLRLTSKNLTRAVEGSLERLKTDRIDLYQIHWPERPTTNFGRRGYPSAAPGEKEDSQETVTPLEETLEALSELIERGLVRHAGLCNETPWGVMTSLRLSEKHGWPPPVSLQNPYNLLNRTFEAALAEIAHQERVPLLAYSPLAFGHLTGKHLHQQMPEGSRLTLSRHFDRYDKPGARQAVQAYDKLAREAGLTLTQLSLAYVRQPRTGVAGAILGASTAAQLKENLACADVVLTPEILRRVDKIHARFPNPCP